MINRALILSASVGGGHTMAAKAIEKAFGDLNVAGEVRNVDVLEYTNKVFRKLYSDAYFELVNRTPNLVGWFYERLDKPWENSRLRLAFARLNTRPLVNMIEEYRPDITVCTHFLPAEIISFLIDKKRLTTRQAIVVTDMDVHSMWLCRNYECYFVALEETRRYLNELGVPAEKIHSFGIPVDPVFAQNKDKAQMRRKHGLDESLPTILISAGGFGVSPVEDLIRALVKMQTRSQVVAFCGKNEKLKSRVEELIQNNPVDCKVTFHAVGYTTEMDEYMSAADLILGKPGGLTTSEALAKGLVFVVFNPIRGQEERNSDHLLEEGAAIRCNNVPVLAYKIDKLLGESERFLAMQKKALRLGCPDAAYDIVKELAQL